MKKFEPKMEFVRFMSEDLIATSGQLDSSTLTVDQLKDIAKAYHGFSFEKAPTLGGGGGVYGLIKVDAEGNETGIYRSMRGTLVDGIPLEFSGYREGIADINPDPNTWYHLIGDCAYVCGDPYEHILGAGGSN